MKKVSWLGGVLPVEAKEDFFIWSQLQATVASCYFIVLCFNLIIAPAVYAAAEGTIERRYAYWCTP